MNRRGVDLNLAFTKTNTITYDRTFIFYQHCIIYPLQPIDNLKVKTEEIKHFTIHCDFNDF